WSPLARYVCMSPWVLEGIVRKSFSSKRRRLPVCMKSSFAEALEPRRLFATITVTTTADDVTPGDGSVSLREAITAINAGNDLGDADINAQAPGTFGVN